MQAEPFCVSEEGKAQLCNAIWHDSTFLSSLNVMDYSLLVGIEKENGKIICGIIDYLRKYTWDKYLESW